MITIRKARLSDIVDLTALLHILFSIEEDFSADIELQSRGLALMISNDHCCIFVATHQEKVIGMCSGQLTVSTAEGGPALLVEDVVLLKKWRSQGIGRSLVDTLANWAAERGAYRLQLLADMSNQQALQFYQQLGWGTTKLICLRKRIT